VTTPPLRGEPKLPPAWLGTHDLPCETLNVDWFRCAYPGRPLLDWDNRVTSRFSGPGLRYRTLYLAEDTATGFWECYGDDLLDREPDDRTISSAAYNSRVVVRFELPSDLRLLNAMSASTLRAIGADGATFKSKYTITQQWASALMNHARAPEGILYESRLNNGKRCLALFETPGMETRLTAGVLRSMADDVDIRAEMIREKVAIL